MSTESGLPDFRSTEGLWADSTSMDAMSESFFRAQPVLFWQHFRALFLSPSFRKATPNAGHVALAGLQMTKDVQIFTQNVDGLHQRAGSRQVHELHGTLETARCPTCHTTYALTEMPDAEVPECRAYTVKGDCATILHPDVVLFEEDIRHYQEAVRAIATCDLLIVAGTSLTVFPVAELPNFRRKTACPLVIVNREETHLDAEADLIIHDSIGAVFSEAMISFW
jgi:NAD-dependent deacetylase